MDCQPPSGPKQKKQTLVPASSSMNWFSSVKNIRLFENTYSYTYIKDICMCFFSTGKLFENTHHMETSPSTWWPHHHPRYSFSIAARAAKHSPVAWCPQLGASRNQFGFVETVQQFHKRNVMENPTLIFDINYIFCTFFGNQQPTYL